MSDKKVFDFTQRRKLNIEQKKRQFERVMLDEFLGVEAVIDENGTGHPVKLIDISAEGCQFHVPFSQGAQERFKKNSEIALKLYCTKNSYLPVIVKIRHATEAVDSKGHAFLRCGAAFETNLASYSALKAFIEFIGQYAEYSCVDDAAHKVYFL